MGRTIAGGGKLRYAGRDRWCFKIFADGRPSTPVLMLSVELSSQKNAGKGIGGTVSMRSRSIPKPNNFALQPNALIDTFFILGSK